MALNEARFEELADKSITVLCQALEQPTIDGAEAQKVNIARSALASYTRFMQVKSAMTATKAMLIRDLASNKTEMLQYLKASTPELNLVKRLK